LPVTVQAILVPVVSVQPASLIISTQTAARGQFLLTERQDRPLPIQTVSVTSPHVRATCSDPIRRPEGWERTIVLEVLPSMPEGRCEDSLKILSNDSRYPELSVPFTVIKHSADRVQASPQSLNLAVLNATPLPSSIVLLSSGGDKPVLVERVETSHPFMQCTWATGPGPRSTLRIQFDRDKMPEDKRFEGSIRVQLRQPTAEVVTIPVHCAKP
jgi:hypothetical protein